MPPFSVVPSLPSALAAPGNRHGDRPARRAADTAETAIGPEHRRIDRPQTQTGQYRNIFESGACRCKRRSLLYNSEMSGKRSVFFKTDAKNPDELIPPTHLTAGTQNVSYVSLSIPTKRREAAPAGGEMPHIHRLSSRALPAFRIRFCDPAYRSRHHISPTDLRFV